MPASVTQQQFDQHAAVLSAQASNASVKTASTDKAKDSDSGFSFDDFLDIINPLQHIPVVSTIYRKLTGDTIKPLERLAGDTLYGGLWGGVSSAANLIFEHVTGKDFGDTAYAMVFGDDSKTTGVASAASPAQQIATAAPRRLSALASNGQTSGLATADASRAPTPLMMASNVPSDLSLRAMAAYKRAIDVADPYAGVGNPIF